MGRTANLITWVTWHDSGNPSQGTAQAADLGVTVARFGGNETSNYNWKLHTCNSAADCKTPVTTSPQTSAYYPLVDIPSQCPTGATDGSTCLDRQTWAQVLATAFANGTCIVPDSPITSCHFYDMDSEIDIWNGTHRRWMETALSAGTRVQPRGFEIDCRGSTGRGPITVARSENGPGRRLAPVMARP